MEVDGDYTKVVRPVMMIPGAHGEEGDSTKAKSKGRGRKGVPLAKSVTSLVYPDGDPHGLISSGSCDGYVFP